MKAPDMESELNRDGVHQDFADCDTADFESVISTAELPNDGPGATFSFSIPF